MADQVQRLLEAMIPELEDYKCRDLFSAAELQSIVQQRTQFEYRLQRKLPIKSDYLLYIQYELNLNALRRKRRKRIAAVTPAAGASKASVSDHAILSRVCFLFERSLRKFHLDVSLWVQYVHFLRSSSSHSLLSRVWPRMHLLHPHETELWLMEAQYHMDNGDVDAMRVCMQRALRLNDGLPSSPLWLRFFAFEVEYIAKVMERKRVLGINVREERAGDLDTRFKAGGTDPPPSSSSSPSPSSALTPLDDVVFHARLPLVIYRNAIARTERKDRQFLLSRKKRKRSAPPPSTSPALATSLPFRLAFLALIPSSSNPHFTLSAYPTPAVRELVSSFMRHNESSYVRKVEWEVLLDAIYRSIGEDFPEEAEAWVVRAKRVARLDAVCAVFEEGVGKGVTGLMKEYLTYLMQACEDAKTSDDEHRKLVSRLERVLDQLLRDAIGVEEPAALLAAQLLVRLKRVPDAARLLAGVCATSRHAEVWLQRIRLTPAAEHAALYSEALTRVEESERHALHVERLQSLVATSSPSSSSSVLAQFHSSLVVCPHERLISLYVDYLAFLLSASTLTLTDIRAATSSLPPLPPVVSLYLIRLHLAHQPQSSASPSPSTLFLRHHFDAALRAEPTSTPLWRAYIRVEREQGHLDFANQLLWRARKHVPDTDLTLDL